MSNQDHDDLKTRPTTTYNHIFAAIVTTIRKERKLSQKEVAERLGLTIAAISKLEAGGTQVTFDHVYALASALNVEPASLFTTVEVGVQSFIDEGGILINNFRKNDEFISKVTPDESSLTDKHHSMLAANTVAALGLSVVNPVVGGAMLLGGLGIGFSKHLRDLVNQSNKTSQS